MRDGKDGLLIPPVNPDALATRLGSLKIGAALSFGKTRCQDDLPGQMTDRLISDAGPLSLSIS